MDARTSVGSWAYEPLTPTSFLHRSAAVHPDRTAVVDGDLRLTYEELHSRCTRLAGSLVELAAGRPVAVLAPDSHVLIEAHHAVPWSGSPLVALNTRLTATELAWIVRHSEASVLVATTEHRDTAAEIAALCPGVVTVEAGGDASGYEDLVAGGWPTVRAVDDEWHLLSINYTSGTTGQPKGVMYHHRGAYLQALAMVVHDGLTSADAYLWTLPMFHCNGCCFPWAVTAAGATNVCLRRIDPPQVWRFIEKERVTIFCGAPTVFTMMAGAPEATEMPWPVRPLTGGAPPTPAIIRRMGELGIAITHLYGLTETFGAIMVNDWHQEWDQLDAGRRAVLASRQEIAVRGNDVMLGYFKDPEAPRAAIPDGWFRTGDLGVVHPDGYIELRDRSKDVIISGGENISSVEVEAALAEHPAVLECAVVAASDPHWGEIPVAFVMCAPSAVPHTEEELVAWVRSRLAHFKAPRSVVFGPLPKTSTGKIQKFVLRERSRGPSPRRRGDTMTGALGAWGSGRCRRERSPW